MQYITLFEIGLKSFPWNGLLHPVPFILVGMLLFRFGKSKQIYQATGIIVAALATIIFLLAAVSLAPSFIELRRGFRSGNSSIVEGVVENFHPAPPLGAAEESFSVNGVNFSYNALDLTPCFHNAPFRKGPIRSGLAIRIYYNDGCIQRLDARQ
jgi:tellurite resistance protein TehA-like permease